MLPTMLTRSQAPPDASKANPKRLTRFVPCKLLSLIVFPLITVGVLVGLGVTVTPMPHELRTRGLPVTVAPISCTLIPRRAL